MFTAIDNAGRIVWFWFKLSTKVPRITTFTVRRLDPPATKEELKKIKQKQSEAY